MCVYSIMTGEGGNGYTSFYEIAACRVRANVAAPVEVFSGGQRKVRQYKGAHIEGTGTANAH